MTGRRMIIAARLGQSRAKQWVHLKPSSPSIMPVAVSGMRNYVVMGFVSISCLKGSYFAGVEGWIAVEVLNGNGGFCGHGNGFVLFGIT